MTKLPDCTSILLCDDAHILTTVCPQTQGIETAETASRQQNARRQDSVRAALPPQLDANGAAAYNQMDEMVNAWRQVARETGQGLGMPADAHSRLA